MYARLEGRKWGGTALAMLLSGLLAFGLVPYRGADAALRRDGRRAEMLALTNQDRQQRDREELGFAAKLARYAKQHSEAMANKGYIYHSTEAQLRDALGNYRWTIGGENVGVGSSLESLEDAFMASKPHRENILRRSFDHMAVGIVRAHDKTWITVVFFG